MKRRAVNRDPTGDRSASVLAGLQAESCCLKAPAELPDRDRLVVVARFAGVPMGELSRRLRMTSVSGYAD
jgi:hypothetical protein